MGENKPQNEDGSVTGQENFVILAHAILRHVFGVEKFYKFLAWFHLSTFILGAQH